MSGGVWKTQNKVLPGAYVNVVAQGQPSVVESDKGVVFTLTTDLSWGVDGVVEVDARSNFMALFGVGIDDPKLTALRNVLIKARKVYVFNFNGGAKATGFDSSIPWEFEARYAGTRGNTLKTSIMPEPNDAGKFMVQTFFDNVLVDKQIVSKASELLATDYFVPTVTDVAKSDDGAALLAALTSPILVAYAGGTDVGGIDRVDALVEAIETYEFNVLTAAGQLESAGIHGLIAEMVITLRDDQGKECQAVVPENQQGNIYDHEGVIVVSNGVKLRDDTILTPTEACGFIAGATSAAEPNQSLTFAEYPDAIDVVPRYNEAIQIEKTRAGVMCFIASRSTVKILEDINSLVTFTPEKTKEFSKNRVLRVLDDIVNDTRVTWEDEFVGKVTNNDDGLQQFKANRAVYLLELEEIGAISNFSASEDVSVYAGDTRDSVVATIVVQPTDAMEKLYLTISMK